MSKCIRCGRSFFGRTKIKLEDAEICSKCFRELGFDSGYDSISHLYKYNDIKNGLGAYYASTLSSSFQVANYGQERDLICTEEERQIFNLVCDYVKDSGLDQKLDLVRVSDNYVTIKLGDWDLVRCKYTNRAKWIMFPTLERDKHEISVPEDVMDYTVTLADSIAHIRKYS